MVEMLTRSVSPVARGVYSTSPSANAFGPNVTRCGNADEFSVGEFHTGAGVPVVDA